MRNAYIYETKLGKILIAEDEAGITNLDLILDDFDIDCNTEFIRVETESIKEAAQQFMEYLEGNRVEFTVKLNPRGTEFQRKVWDELLKIPYGETRSYKQIAEAVGNGKASRAVGMANHNNPIMCMIPCHRVIGSNGSMVGYAGGLPVKVKLLELERSKESEERK
ncbi:MAG TPA: methylated-DNA--[protein]-cysteine S-methyltransferase [Mobilitalea sp.]|nr:methylated-DNA--[protein]-cysteine S-methyltransferase [Mobilitalea sp.]